MMNTHKYVVLLLIGLLTMISCVERGKPIKKDEPITIETKKKGIAHYICPKGHKGSDAQGTCPECGSVYLHNQLYHGNAALPQPSLQDPFNSNSTPSNTASAPAQNAYGDYHYICPKGHPGGSATAGSCKVCDAKLVHNQIYHK